jgi:hypothetical protein
VDDNQKVAIMLSRYQQSGSSLFSWIPVSDFFLVMTVFLMMCVFFVVGTIPADTNETQTERLGLELKKRNIAVDSPHAGGVSLKTQIDKLLQRFDELLAETQTDEWLRNELANRNIDGVSLKMQIDKLLQRFDELLAETQTDEWFRKELANRNIDGVSLKLQIDNFLKRFDELEGLANSLKELGEKVKRKQQQLVQYRLNMKDRFLKPLDSARLVVKIRTELPSQTELDLDLYVQDPMDKLCFWKTLRVFTERGEQAMIIPSEDLRMLRDLSDREGLPSTEEKYCAKQPILKRPKKPYLIFVMLRKIGASTVSSVEQVVKWEVIVKNEKLEEVAKEFGQRTMTTTGALTTRGKDVVLYQGLRPLFGFDVADQGGLKIELLPNKDLPDYLRDWEPRDNMASDPPLQKFRDKKRK